MKLVQKKLVDLLGHWRTTGMLHVVYALAIEALFISSLYFIGLFTIETLLPTFITVRLSLTKFFFFLILATFLLSLLGRFLSLSFPWNITKKSPLLWLSILWSIGILAVSMIKFPFAMIPLLIALFLFSGSLFWSIFFEEKN